MKVKTGHPNSWARRHKSSEIRRMLKKETLMRYLLCLVLLLVICLSPVGAQTVDTAILGTLLDPQGAPVAGATVTITQPSTGLSHTASTSPEGTFEIRYLVPGEYVVEIHAAGFRGERRAGVVIQLGQQARLDFTLQVGAVQETVEVNAGVPLLQTENATSPEWSIRSA